MQKYLNFPKLPSLFGKMCVPNSFFYPCELFLSEKVKPDIYNNVSNAMWSFPHFPINMGSGSLKLCAHTKKADFGLCANTFIDKCQQNGDF